MPSKKPRSSRRLLPRLLVPLGLAILAGSAQSIISHRDILYDRVPLDRLLENIGRQARKSPRNAHLNYLLGRIHTFAYVYGLNEVLVCDREAPLRVPTRPALDRELRARGEELRQVDRRAEPWPARRNGKRATSEAEQVNTSDSQRQSHLERALYHSAIAVSLEPDSPIHQLALASILDQGARFADEFDATPFLPNARREVGRLPEELASILDAAADRAGVLTSAEKRTLVSRGALYLPILNRCRTEQRLDRFLAIRTCLSLCWKREAMLAYARAFTLAAESDIRSAEDWRHQEDYFGALDLVSYEAGKSLLRVRDEIGYWPVPRPLMATDIERHLAELTKLEDRMPVSPVIFSLEREGDLSSLLAEGTSVYFDLDGDGQAERWPWVEPDTAILVWDPDQRGEIRSGRQLFGSVSWWIFFRDGYEALAGLDDDGNGWLAGDELTGLGLWFDRDSNGISGAGEVVPIECTAVQAIATWSDTIDGLAPGCTAGLVLDDGRRLPTYDWMAEPLPSSEAPDATAVAVAGGGQERGAGTTRVPGQAPPEHLQPSSHDLLTKR